MMTSSGGMPGSPATETIFFATSTRRSGSIGISSSFASPITAAPCFATSGRIASSRSSSPVTELTSALPWYAERPASSASITEESMHSGSSQRPCTSGIALPIRSTSSASGSPTFTSSMSAPPATCCAMSTSSCERSPAWSCAWNAFRPVGLIRSPITQNGCSGPMTTVLDGDWTIVSTRLPFCSRWNPEPLAQPGDAGLAAEADQVEAGDSRQRARVLRELDRELEALRLRVGPALAALDRRNRHLDPRHVLVDVAEGGRRAGEADRGKERAPLGEAHLDGLRHERLELLGPERDLQLEEARAGAHLLQHAVDAVVERRRARVLDGAEEEPRRRAELAAREIRPARHRGAAGEQLDRVEVEDAPRLGLVAGGDVVAGEAEDVLDPVQRRTGDLGLEAEAVPVAAGQLHDRLHPELLQRARHRERRGVRMGRGVVGRVRRVDVVLERNEPLVHGVEAARVDGQELGRDDEAASRERLLKPRHASPSVSACPAPSRG